jgi:hypothetical protein
MSHPSVHLRLSPTLLDAINKWRANQADAPTKPQAIRDLVEEALKARQAQTEVGDKAAA